MGALDSLPTRSPSRNETVVAMLILSASVALLAWLGASTHTYTIDSYVYLAKARSLASGNGFTVPWNDGIDRKFFWGYSIALAAPLRLFGEKGWIVLACILHACLGATFFALLCKLEKRAVVRLAALALLAFIPLLLWWGSVPASEPLFTLLVLASIRRALAFRSRTSPHDFRNVFLAAIYGGFAAATRAEGVLLFPILAIVTMPKLWRDRRFAVALACFALCIAPEATHVAYLHHNALTQKSASAYVDELFGHSDEIHWADAAWENLRAPFWTIFRFDTEADSYARFFPQWLVVAQTIVAYMYFASIAIALGSGAFRRSTIFFCALAIVFYAVIHGVWYYRYERFMTVSAPFAALVLATVPGNVLRLFARARVAPQIVFGLAASSVAAICAIYGSQVSRMHADRLASREDHRDYAALAARIDALDPSRRPVVNDFGPYLASFVRDRRSYFLNGNDFYAAGVPWCDDGRAFLVERNVGVVVSKEAASTIANRLDLSADDYDRVAGAITMLVLHLRQRSPQTSDVSTHEFSSPPILGRKVALERIETNAHDNLGRCGEVRVMASARVLDTLAAGDHLFVHANDAGHPATRFDVEEGVALETSESDSRENLAETFVVHLPASFKTEHLEVWVGLWNAYSGARFRLEGGDGERDDENRLLAGRIDVVQR
jgi:hypothetical protein